MRKDLPVKGFRISSTDTTSPPDCANKVIVRVENITQREMIDTFPPNVPDGFGNRPRKVETLTGGY